MPATSVRRSRKKRSRRKHCYSPSPIKGAPCVTTRRGSRKKKTSVRRNLSAALCAKA